MIRLAPACGNQRHGLPYRMARDYLDLVGGETLWQNW